MHGPAPLSIGQTHGLNWPLELVPFVHDTGPLLNLSLSTEIKNGELIPSNIPATNKSVYRI
jgi:hypothetical protein